MFFKLLPVCGNSILEHWQEVRAGYGLEAIFFLREYPSRVLRMRAGYPRSQMVLRDRDCFVAPLLAMTLGGVITSTFASLSVNSAKQSLHKVRYGELSNLMMMKY